MLRVAVEGKECIDDTCTSFPLFPSSEDSSVSSDTFATIITNNNTNNNNNNNNKGSSCCNYDASSVLDEYEEYNDDDDFEMIGTTTTLGDLDRSCTNNAGGVSSNDGGKTTNSTSTNNNNNSNNESEQQLAQRETRAVFRLRFLVMLVLTIAGTAVSFVVYLIARNAELDEFLTQYEGSSQKVLEAFQGIVSQKIGAISSLGVASIAHGVDHSRTWPFVTLSSFQQRSSTARSLSKALFVAINPFILASERIEWEKYVLEDEAFYWIPEGFAYQEALGLNEFLQNTPSQYTTRHSCSLTRFDPTTNQTCSASTTEEYGDFHEIFYYDNDDVVVENSQGPYMAVWQTSPLLHGWVNQNLFRNNMLSSGAQRCLNTQAVVIGGIDVAPAGNSSHPDRMTAFYSSLLSVAEQKHVTYRGDPMSTVYLPVFSSFEPTRRPVAVMIAIINWASYFQNVLPPSTGSKNFRGVVIVLENECDGSYTYEISGEDVYPLGPGDQHNPRFAHLQKTASFQGLLNIADGTKYGLDLNQDFCPYKLRVYPSERHFEAYSTDTPIRITFAVVMCFAITAIIFLCYDYLVEQRQKLVLTKANQSTAIVSSLFPKNVRDRLMEETEHQSTEPPFMGPNSRLKSFLSSDPAKQKGIGRQPIADLFPSTTVLFADIAGFTAWSSTRDPVQVFILLQTVYHVFDTLAKKHNVFKIETIGDCYVAVTGLPDPQEKHAVIMARFAGDCMVHMNEITRQLEISLGPETGELTIRVGMNSGPVTAGVLRGERARFQLFGDTVNTASRMESTGIRNRIQVSQTTANLLVSAGKGHWLRPRKDKVQAKGKGLLNTYWLNPITKRRSSTSSVESQNSDSREAWQNYRMNLKGSSPEVKRSRHVDWICELLQEQIKKVVAVRARSATIEAAEITYKPVEGTTALDEVAEVICLPKFNPEAVPKAGDHRSVDLSSVVCKQIRDFISHIAAGYHDNPFHNFEHACHVTMSVSKLLNRIVAPELEIDELDDMASDSGDLASQIHDYTHGINSDPLAVLAIFLSAIIHDVDHRGVSNGQLIIEDSTMAETYKNKSVAEQNSFDIAWNLLMSESCAELRKCIFATESDLKRFRQVMVNVVMATDIFDKELNDLRKARWEKAFSSEEKSATADKNDLKATIVIEHIIQASDVSHTMQHWHIYRKWNTKLFQEMYLAYRSARMPTDPSTFWYQGELLFFDNYIIPLAKKLKDCKIFGVSSDEYLNYAMQNRAEWEERGLEILEQMKEDCVRAFESQIPGSPCTAGSETSPVKDNKENHSPKASSTGVLSENLLVQ